MRIIHSIEYYCAYNLLPQIESICEILQKRGKKEENHAVIMPLTSCKHIQNLHLTSTHLEARGAIPMAPSLGSLPTRWRPATASPAAVRGATVNAQEGPGNTKQGRDGRHHSAYFSERFSPPSHTCGSFGGICLYHLLPETSSVLPGAAQSGSYHSTLQPRE